MTNRESLSISRDSLPSYRLLKFLPRTASLLNKLLFTLACLVLPILWGVFVNWFFNVLSQKKRGGSDDESIFPDYQI